MLTAADWQRGEADELIHQCLKQLERNTCLNRDPLATQCLAAIMDATRYRLTQFTGSRYPCCLTGTYTHGILYQYEFYRKDGVCMQSYLVLPVMQYFIEAVMLLRNYTTVLHREQVQGAHQYIHRFVAALKQSQLVVPRRRKRPRARGAAAAGVKLEPVASSS